MVKSSKCHVCGAFPLSKEDKETARINKLAVAAAEAHRILREINYPFKPSYLKKIRYKSIEANIAYAKAIKQKEKKSET